MILSQALTKQANSEQLEYLPMILDNNFTLRSLPQSTS